MDATCFPNQDRQALPMDDGGALLRTLVEISVDAIVVVDRDGRFRYANPAHERLIGYSAADIAGWPFFKLVHPDDRAFAARQFDALVRNPEQVVALKTRLLHKDGSVRHVEATGKALPNGDFAGYLRDVTGRRQAATALQESEASFRTLVEISVDGVVIVRPDSTFEYANAQFLRALGYDYDELVGQSFVPKVHPDDLDAIQTKMANLLTLPGRTETAEFRFGHKNGSWCALEGMAKLLPSGNVVAYLRDITEQKQAEAKRRAGEERFRTLVETSADGISLVDRQGRYLYVSPAFEQVTGYTSAELVGQLFGPIIHADDLSYAMAIFEDIFRFPGQPISYELRLWHKDGSLRLVEGTARQLPDGDLVSYVRDITERRQLELELRQLNAELEQRVEERTLALQTALAESRRLSAILEVTPDLVAMADLQGRALYLNQSGRRFYGLGETEDVGKLDFTTAYPPEVTAKMLGEYLPYALQHGGVWHGESRLLLPDGDQLPVSQVGIIHFGPDGQPERLSTIVRDISEQKQIQAELQAAKEAAESANKAKSTFLANMSHEIRTPMNAVIGMTGLLLNTPLNEKQRDFVETIRASGDALLTVINDILDFSKIEAGKLELESQPFDLRSCVESALDLLAPHAAEKGLDLAYEMGDDVPGAIVGDVTRLRQIVVNLVGNGIKFTERGEVVVSVRSESSGLSSESNISTPQNAQGATQAALLHFAVKDSGIGMPNDKLARLFQSFSQLDSSTTREYGGTGLGLAISKRLAELMGGRMWAESAGPGTGSTFHFTLRAHSTPAPVRSHLQNRQPMLAGKRLLIVDDNATNRRILALQTQIWGMQAVEASSPSQALGIIDQGQLFDLALLDMHMPEMDGALLAEALCRAHTQRGRHFPLILLTSLGFEARPELEAVACFSAYLTKPVKPSQLYDVLVGVLTDEEREARRAQSPEPIPQAPPARLSETLPIRILLAEDVVVNQKFALLALDEMGLNADVAANGLEALEALKRQPYDVVLMDVQMPELDGLDATRRIRNEFPARRQPHIIAMTANAMQGDRELCLEAGMDDYISKPVYLEELRAALERAGQRLRNLVGST